MLSNSSMNEGSALPASQLHLSRTESESMHKTPAVIPTMTKAQPPADQNLWQHPFVDVLKHSKLIPGSDWKLNKRQGQVSEYFAQEIGRRALNIEGTISANNFVQIPNPTSNIKSLGLTGRYIYFQVKQAKHGVPFSYHVDLTMADRPHGLRISISNLFKSLDTQSGFIVQVPLELKNNCWSVCVIDIYEILRQSSILPSTYLIDGSYRIKSINVCANTHLRGIFTSNNMYDFVTLPADMRYKFAFDLERWTEYFNWQSIPHDWGAKRNGDQNQQLESLINQNKKIPVTKEEQRDQMQREIDEIVGCQARTISSISERIDVEQQKKERYDAMQNQLNQQFNKGPANHPTNNGFVKNDEVIERQLTDYRLGQFSGHQTHKSDKFSHINDPVMELKHIIGYQPEKCKNIKWSRQNGENVVIFTSGGTIIAMNSETNEQKKFYFGHSDAISCFDINNEGTLLASAQEGNNSVIRIWDYASAKSVAFSATPVQSVQCLSFSHDGMYLSGYGTVYTKNGKEIKKSDYEAIMADQNSDERTKVHSKELIVIYDISHIHSTGRIEIIAKQTSEFNILSLRFSPVDSMRLISCGKENIRFWKIQNHGNIRGTAVVLGHHARDTYFTCLDFNHETGQQNFDKIYVGTQHGTVFQINYNSETMETSHKTNNGAIHSIAINNDFCVTGSDDTFLRVWPLDFQEWFIEAQLEQQAINAVDISPDGLKVVCGTIHGSIGILDKSNQEYKTLIRSHTEEIIAIDFHKTKNHIISISKDKTIRLWSIESYDEVYEFTAHDQPISVSAHPSKPIFACGFASGCMRVFDIDNQEVIEEFNLFNDELQSLKYDNSGSLLIACCKDGRLSVHNAARQHLSVKQMELADAPESAYIAFSEVSAADPAFLEQKFAVMGETGNNVVVYDTEAFMQHNRINCNNIVTRFKFANNNQDMVIVTKDCKIQFFSLVDYNGVFMREILNVHRGSVSSISITNNSGYFLTGGEDSMVKIWDYEAQKNNPSYFQSFIGHTYQVNDVIFNPNNNSQVITVGQHDGIFVWNFNGDIQQDYHRQDIAGQDLPLNIGQRAPLSVTEAVPCERNISELEKLRTAQKKKKAFRNLMKEDSFIIPEWVPLDESVKNTKYGTAHDFYPSPPHVAEARKEEKVSRNHFIDCEMQVEKRLRPKGDASGTMKKKTMKGMKHKPKAEKVFEPKLINGYDGFGGVHDNLGWHINGGNTIFTLFNKIVIESTKSREQVVITTSAQSQLSCMTYTDDYKFVAVGEGSNGINNFARVIIYDLEQRDKDSGAATWEHKKHPKGVQSISFSFAQKGCQPSYLVSIGTVKDSYVCVYSLDNSKVFTVNMNDDPRFQIPTPFDERVHSSNGTNSNLQTPVINQVRVDPVFVEDCSYIKFFMVGNKGTLISCKFNPSQKDKLEYVYQAKIFDTSEIDLGQNQNLDYTCMAFTERNDTENPRFIVIGSNVGGILTFEDNEANLNGGEFVKEDGFEETKYDYQSDLGSDIMCISIPKTNITGRQSILIGGASGKLWRYEFNGIYDFYDRKYLQTTTGKDFKSSIIAMSFDEKNKEGLVGTEQGCIYYVAFEEKDEKDRNQFQSNNEVFRLVTSNNMFKEAIDFIKYDELNPQLVIANTSQKCNDVKMYAVQNCDQVTNFAGGLDEDNVNLDNHQDDGYAVFSVSSKHARQYRSMQRRLSFVGYSNGIIKRINWSKLEMNPSFKLPLQANEKLTCGFHSENDYNFVIGTNYGNMFVCSVQPMGKQKNVSGTFCRIENVGKMNSQIIQNRIDTKQDTKTTLINQDIQNVGSKMTEEYSNNMSGSDFDLDNQLQIYAGPEDESIQDKQSNEDIAQDIISVTSVHFMSSDPIGTMIITFDNGKIRIWRSAVKNEQLMKIIELDIDRNKNDNKKQTVDQNTVAKYDISQVGYQQFDVAHQFDIYGEADMDEKKQNEFRNEKCFCQAQFLGKNFTTNLEEGEKTGKDESYLCFSQQMEFLLIVQDWNKPQPKVKKIELKISPEAKISQDTRAWPMCMKIIDCTKIYKFEKEEEEGYTSLRQKIKGKQQPGGDDKKTDNKKYYIMILVGTKCGKMQLWTVNKIGTFENLACQSPDGLSYGAITSIDAMISRDKEEIICGTESGEIIQFDLKKKLDEQIEEKNTKFE